MKLSETAVAELKDVLRIDMSEAVGELIDKDFNDFGMFALTVAANSLKIQAQEMKNRDKVIAMLKETCLKKEGKRLNHEEALGGADEGPALLRRATFFKYVANKNITLKV